MTSTSRATSHLNGSSGLYLSTRKTRLASIRSANEWGAAAPDRGAEQDYSGSPEQWDNEPRYSQAQLQSILEEQFRQFRELGFSAGGDHSFDKGGRSDDDLVNRLKRVGKMIWARGDLAVLFAVAAWVAYLFFKHLL